MSSLMDEKDTGRKGPSRWLLALVAILAAALVAFSAWALAEYRQGRDPLAFLGGSEALTTTDEAAGEGQDEAPASDDAAGTSAAAGADEDAAQGQADDGASDDGGDASASATSDGASAGGDATSAGGGGASSAAGSGSASAQDGSAGGDASSQQRSGQLSIPVTIDASPAGGSTTTTTVTVAAGSTVYDALRATGASLNASDTVYGIYVASINGLAEKEHGAMSGWVYAVNGVEPNTACSNYALSAGDRVTWTYVNVER